MNDINVIRFERSQQSFPEWIGEDNYEDIPFISTDVYIDNQSFIDLLKQYELPFAQKINHPEIAGLYVGGDPSDPLEAIEQFEKFNPDSKIGLYQCAKCYSGHPFDLEFRIRKEGQFVYWYDFGQEPQVMPPSPSEYNAPVVWRRLRPKDTHADQMKEKSKWNYDNFGPFKFDVNEYMKALDKCRQIVKLEVGRNDWNPIG